MFANFQGLMPDTVYDSETESDIKFENSAELEKILRDSGYTIYVYKGNCTHMNNKGRCLIYMKRDDTWFRGIMCRDCCNKQAREDYFLFEIREKMLRSSCKKV